MHSNSIAIASDENENYQSTALVLSILGYQTTLACYNSPQDTITEEYSNGNCTIRLPRECSLEVFRNSNIDCLNCIPKKYEFPLRIVECISFLSGKLKSYSKIANKKSTSLKSKLLKFLFLVGLGNIAIIIANIMLSFFEGLHHTVAVSIISEDRNCISIHRSTKLTFIQRFFFLLSGLQRPRSFLPGAEGASEDETVEIWRSMFENFLIEQNGEQKKIATASLPKTSDIRGAIRYLDSYPTSPLCFLWANDASGEFLANAIRRRKLVVFVANEFSIDYFLSSPLSSIISLFDLQVHIIYESNKPKIEQADKAKLTFQNVTIASLSELSVTINSKEYNYQSEFSHTLAEKAFSAITEKSQPGNYVKSFLEISPSIGKLFRESIAIEILRTTVATSQKEAFDRFYLEDSKIFIDANFEPRFTSQTLEPSLAAMLPQGHFPCSISRTFEAWRLWGQRRSIDLDRTNSLSETDFCIEIPKIETDNFIEISKVRDLVFSDIIKDSAVCIALAPGDIQYRETALDTAKHYVNRGTNVSLFITTREETSRFYFNDFCENCSALKSSSNALFEHSYLRTDRVHLNSKDEKLEIHLSNLLHDLRDFEATNLMVEALRVRINAFLDVIFPDLCQAYFSFKYLFSETRPSVIVSIPARPSMSLAMSLAAQSLSIPQVCVESSLFGREPRLKPMYNELTCVIDSHATHLLVDYYDVSPDKIRTIGSQHLYRRNQLIMELTREKLLNTTKPDPITLTVCTQSDGLDPNLELVRWCALATSQHEDLRLILKPHPSENDFRLQAYTHLLSEIGVPFEVATGGLYEALVKTSVLCTRYSTVCYEAYFADVPTISCWMQGDDRVLDFEEIGLALNANSASEFFALVTGLMDPRSATFLKLKTLRNEYANQNKHLTNEDPLERLVGIIDALVVETSTKRPGHQGP